LEVSQTTQVLDLPFGLAAVSIGLQRRTKKRIVAARQLVDKIRKTGRKRDAPARIKDEIMRGVDS
jgi:hypothetical protein